MEERISELLGVGATEMQPVSGGDFAAAYRVSLEDGRTVFAKTHTNPPPNFFSTEAAGLSWLAEPGECNVARVLAVADEAPAMLVLEWIDVGGRQTQDDEAEFGRSLARLHRVGGAVFGREDGRTTGSQALPNEPCAGWPEFYSQQRLIPLAKIARDRNALPQDSVARLEKLAGRLEEFGASDEPPARLHGDLWAGNRVVDTSGKSWLVDPAAHGGHREFDLAMMRLFGGFGERAFRSYDEEFQLVTGWQDRVPLHQLAPLVVHAIKFGGGYVGAVDAALSELS